jgi:hypothetical protein
MLKVIKLHGPMNATFLRYVCYKALFRHAFTESRIAWKGSTSQSFDLKVCAHHSICCVILNFYYLFSSFFAYGFFLLIYFIGLYCEESQWAARKEDFGLFEEYCDARAMFA